MNKAQDIQIQWLALAKMNELDGARIAADLRANEKLWRRAMLMATETTAFLPLRDLADAGFMGDRLYIVAPRTATRPLKRLTAEWNYDVRMTYTVRQLAKVCLLNDDVPIYRALGEVGLRTDEILFSLWRD